MASHRAKSKFQKLPLGLALIASIFATTFIATVPTQATVGDVSLYLSEPYVQGSHVSGPDVLAEDFNSFATGACPTSIAIGSVSATSPCLIASVSAYGGASGAATEFAPVTGGVGSKYMTTGSGGEITVTLTNPAKYVGLWWSAGNSGNVVTFYNGNTVLATVNTSSLTPTGLLGTKTSPTTLTTVLGTTTNSANYFGNPRSTTTLASPEPFSYLNLLLSGVSATKIVFSGSGFEFDNLVTSTQDIGPTGDMVFVSSSSGSSPIALPQTVSWSPTNTSVDVGSSPLIPSVSASVTRPVSGGGAISYTVVRAGTTGCTVNDVTGEITYATAGTCLVRATAAAVTGTPSYYSAYLDVPFTIGLPGTPPAPTAVAGDTTATVTVASNVSGGAPDSYLVTSSPGARTCTVTVPATSCIVTGLTNGTPYTFTTTATNAAGTSTASSPSNSVIPSGANQSTGEGSSAPAILAKVTFVEIKPGSQAGKSIIQVKLAEAPTASYQVDVQVRLFDFSGKLLKMFTVPVSQSVGTLEVDWNFALGDFNADATAVTATASSTAVKALPKLVNKAQYQIAAKTNTPVLAGKAAGTIIFFAANSAKLTAKAKADLIKVSKKLKATNSRVALTGFTSQWVKGKPVEFNLATRRSLEAAKFLRSQGVTNWVYYSGYGSMPRTTDDVTARKVEIRVLD